MTTFAPAEVAQAEAVRAEHSARRIASSALWLFGERGIRLLAQLVTSIVLARYLGPSDYGLFAFAMSLVLLMTMLAGGGLSVVVIRDLVRYPHAADRILGSVMFFKFVYGLAIFAGLVGVAAVVQRGDGVSILLVAILGGAALAYSLDCIVFWFHSRVATRFSVIARSVALVSSSGAIVAACLLGLPLVYIAMAAGLESVLIGLGLIIAYKVAGGAISHWRISMRTAGYFVRKSWPLLIAVIAGYVNLKGDLLMLAALSTTDELGQYAVAARISEAWYFVPYALVTPVYPMLVHLWSTDVTAYRKRMQFMYDLVVWICLPVAAFVSLVGAPAIALVYGHEFNASATILAIHIWASPFAFMAPVLHRSLILEDRAILLMRRQIMAALVNVALNLVLIPLYGAIGAAFATLLSYATASYLVCFIHPETRETARQMSLAFIWPLRFATSSSWLPRMSNKMRGRFR